MVWITQTVKNFNIEPARDFGEIKILCPQGQGATWASGATIARLKMEFSKFDYKKDFLLLIGDPVLIAITAAVASYWTNGKFNILKWDRQERVYIPVEINI